MHDVDRTHPLYRINLLMPGQTRIDRSRPRVFLKTLRKDRHGDIMQEYQAPTGMPRTTLSVDVLKWLDDEKTDQISVLAGYGLTWVTIWSMRDATLFKVFHL